MTDTTNRRFYGFAAYEIYRPTVDGLEFIDVEEFIVHNPDNLDEWVRESLIRDGYPEDIVIVMV